MSHPARKNHRARSLECHRRRAGTIHTRGNPLKKLLVLAAAAAGLTFAAMAPASAAGQLCYDVNVNVAGQAPIAQSGCQDLPTP
jgi:hypothetical protein